MTNPTGQFIKSELHRKMKFTKGGTGMAPRREVQLFTRCCSDHEQVTVK